MGVVVRVALFAAAASAVAQGARSSMRAQQQLGANASPSAEVQADMAEVQAEMAEVVAICTDTQFAFCGMATCATTPLGGIASCACWVGYGQSIAPGPIDGALTTNQTDLCGTMNTTLYSTAPSNATQSVPTAPAMTFVTCPVETVSVEVFARRLAAARRVVGSLRRRSCPHTLTHRVKGTT